MRTLLLMAAAGLMWLLPVSARAQYYGWGYYEPYYPAPYGYYPEPYDAPPPMYDGPPRRIYRSAHKIQHHIVLRRHRIVHRALVNPLLGPLPGASPRQN